MNKSKLTLYLVTDSSLAAGRDDGMSLEQIVEQAVKGGVSIVQLREKHLDEEAFIQEGRRFKAILSKYGVPLIINDNVKVALECGADGVHIGQSDMNYAQARALLGPDKIIGLSVETLDELKQANSLDVDYVAASPVFSTPTKTDTARPWGLDGLREFVALSKHPVVAIGGINKDNIGEIFACGADGVAVVSAIVCATSPYHAAQELLQPSRKRLQAAQELLSDKRNHSCTSGEEAKASCYELGEFGLIRQIAAAFKEDGKQVPCDATAAGEQSESGAGVQNFTDEQGDEHATGIGDDCAILPQRSGFHTLVSTDMLIEGTHFILDDIPAWDLGWKSAAVNISDIAAMGGRPVGTFLSVALPRKISVAWIKNFIEGYKACAMKFGAPLLGGDTTSSPDRLCINVTVLGECAAGKPGQAGREKLRSTARPGDLICVTGELGDSAGGLQVILNGLEHDGARANWPEHDGARANWPEHDGARANWPEHSDAAKRLVGKHYHPVPRVVAGLELAKFDGVHAMMDISDGVASDLRHILEASGVSATIYTDRIPVSDDLKEVCQLLNAFPRGNDDACSDGSQCGNDDACGDGSPCGNRDTCGNDTQCGRRPSPLELALTGGEDYELLFTVDPETEKQLDAVRHFVIGEITESGPDGPTVKWAGADGDFMGFRHF